MNIIDWLTISIITKEDSTDGGTSQDKQDDNQKFLQTEERVDTSIDARYKLRLAMRNFPHHPLAIV